MDNGYPQTGPPVICLPVVFDYPEVQVSGYFQQVCLLNTHTCLNKLTIYIYYKSENFGNSTDQPQ